MMMPIDSLIEMVKCCYFVGRCKLCPFYKEPKFGMIGKCMGSQKVGEALLDFLLMTKAKEQAEQLGLQYPPVLQEEEADAAE